MEPEQDGLDFLMKSEPISGVKIRLLLIDLIV